MLGGQGEERGDRRAESLPLSPRACRGTDAPCMVPRGPQQRRPAMTAPRGDGRLPGAPGRGKEAGGEEKGAPVQREEEKAGALSVTQGSGSVVTAGTNKCL